MFDFKNIKPYARLVLLKIRYFMLSQRCREYLIFYFYPGLFRLLGLADLG